MSHHDTGDREHILLTGATGFLGKVVLEELLRTRENADITLIVRAKGKRTASDRLNQLRKSPCFDGLTHSHFDRVEAVTGDLATDGCGLADEDRTRITGRTTRVVHCAASIDFDLRVQDAAKANIDATLNVMEMARACEKLVSVVSVSTAYVTPKKPGRPISEELVEIPGDAEELYERIHSGDVTTEELTAVTGHPNSYTLTKCLAEHLIAARFPDLPITILRPSIISACRHYPSPGWLDSRAAFAAFVALIGSGHLRAIVAHRNTVMDVVPCDVVAIHIIEELFRSRSPSGNSQAGITVRHSTTGIENGPSVTRAGTEILKFFRRYPVDHPPRLRYIGPANALFRLADYFEHTRGLGSKRIPMSPAKAKFIRKQVQYVNRAFRYFTLNSFDFRTSLQWPFEREAPEIYLRTICEGVYRNILNGKPHSLLIGGKRFGTLHRELSASATDRGVVRRLGTQVSRRADKLTVDEQALAQVRAEADDDSLVVFRPGGGLSGAETAILCAYTILVRGHLGFSALWLVPGKMLPARISSLLHADANGDGRHDNDPVAIVAPGPPHIARPVIMRDVKSLQARLEKTGRIMPVTVAASIERTRGEADSQDHGREHIVLASESALSGLRDGVCGARLLERATQALQSETDLVHRIHLGFQVSE